MAVSRTVPVSRVKPAPRVAKATPAPTKVPARTRQPKSPVTTGMTEAQQLWADEERQAKGRQRAHDAKRFEEDFEELLNRRHLGHLFKRNVHFLDGFNYRGDFVNTADKLLVEIDGGVGVGQMNKRQQRAYLQQQALLVLAGKEPKLRGQGGHHNNPAGYRYDRIRDCEAILQGWTVLRFPPDMVTDGSAIDYTERVLKSLWSRNKRTA